MKNSSLSRCVLTCAAAAMLAGCGGSQPPVGAPGAMPYGATSGITAHSMPTAGKGAWSGDLLYVATGGDVYVLSYPSGKVVGPSGSGRRRQPVFGQSGGRLSLWEAQVRPSWKYSHRGKLVQTLAVYDVPSSCSVDPTDRESRGAHL